METLKNQTDSSLPTAPSTGCAQPRVLHIPSDEGQVSAQEESQMTGAGDFDSVRQGKRPLGMTGCFTRVSLNCKEVEEFDFPMETNVQDFFPPLPCSLQHKNVFVWKDIPL